MLYELHPSGGAKVVDASGQLRGAHSIVERDTLTASLRRAACVASRAKQFARVGEKRRLADAAGHEAHLLQAAELRKAIAKRPPYFERLAIAQLR